MKTGATVSTSAIKAIVVFTNPDLTLPEEIEQNSCVLMAAKIPLFCRSLQKTWRQYLTDPLIPSLLSGALSYKQISASGSGMKKAGTWDKLYLTGGRTVDGDFKVIFKFPFIMSIKVKFNFPTSFAFNSLKESHQVYRVVFLYTRHMFLKILMLG